EPQEAEPTLGREAPYRDAPQLRLDRGDVAWMRVPEARDRDPGEEIEVGVAIEIRDRRALAGVERQLGEQRNALLSGRDHRLLRVNRLARPWSRLIVHANRSPCASRTQRRARAATGARRRTSRSRRRPRRDSARSSANR